LPSFHKNVVTSIIYTTLISFLKVLFFQAIVGF